MVWVLNNYLGKYVENLNTDQLSVALLSGKVELENLPLRKDALRHLGLPVEVRAGFIGKVQLQVPVRQIRSAPWIISIERVYVVVAPVNLDEWDSGVEAAIAHERKVSLLDAVEAQWRAEREAQDPNYYATSYSSWLSYGTGLLANIVENLQLKINDVHFRYEDTATVSPSMAFACGLTISSLSAESCDKAWNRGFTLLSDSDPCSYKLVELEKLSAYWEPGPQLLANCDLTELQSRMSPQQVSGQCVLPACGGRAAIRRERTTQPLRSRSRPRLHCRLTLAALSLHLSDRQYKSAVRCARGLALLAQRREWRALRPSTAVGEKPRAWWVYAVKCHLPHHTWMEPAPTWHSCLLRAREAIAYVDVCGFMLANPAATLPPYRKSLKDDIEWNWPLHLLKALREVALSRLPRPGPARDRDSASRSMLVRWFPQWWGWYSPPDTTPVAVDSPSAAEVEDLEEEILDVIADSLENNTLLKRDTVFGEFEFLLNDACLILHEDNEEEIIPRLEAQLCAVRVHMMSRPRASSLSLSLSVGDLSLRDRLTVDTLFPVLVASQGMIREGLSASFTPLTTSSVHRTEPLFLISYETKPSVNCDYKLYVKSQSLEVVYNTGVAQWASDFLSSAPATLADTISVPHTTKMKIMNHWEQILQGEPNERGNRQIELDISAPQILLVEDFKDRDGAVLLVDFGKMRVTNGPVTSIAHDGSYADPFVDDEDELFMTPCSTPPASPLSPLSPLVPLSPPSPLAGHSALDQLQLRKRLYDTYVIELSDLQVLVGRARDNWKFAHTKSTSSLHILDRFNISLQAERRVIQTSDPQFPAATVCGALPALVVHLSEQKLAAVRALTNTLSIRLADSPAEERTASVRRAGSESPPTECTSNSDASLFMLQFAVEQMSLEVQSRGRSIAEVQVCGVRIGISRRPCERSLSLSVHSLLLVDALQTYGPDYELLVASHKHIGMDVTSGSILGSEPSSPRSTRAASSPCIGNVYNTSGWGSAGVVDSEALIAVEVCFVRGDGDGREELRIANILFNNLDIIANQETIVELIGFTQRVTGTTNNKAPAQNTKNTLRGISPERTGCDVKTEITFDFHRLGVLLLRAATQDGAVVAKKIATATLSNAKIQATLDGELVSAAGSLGAVQVVSQRRGSLHRRLLAVSSDRALDFTLQRSEGALAVRLQVASVTYTHCPATVAELRSCGAEFAQYLSNLARSIRAAAADMAIGLMQGSQSSSRNDGISPRRRTVSEGNSLDRTSSSDRLEPEKIILSVSVELETPVVVLPCALDSARVFVAQLGRMTLVNKGARYSMKLRDISLYTTDVISPGGSAGDVSSGKPVLHDTALHLTLHHGDSHDGHTLCEVTGGIVGGLRVSSTREQYEQLLRTVQYMGATDGEGERGPRGHEEPREVDAAVTLRLDPHVRAQAVVPPPERSVSDTNTYFKVNFSLPTFTVELRGDLGCGERSLVDLSFSDFNVNYEKLQPYETSVQVSLHSVTMEDLTKDVEAKHRMLMVSHSPRMPKAVFVSKSCPDFISEYPKESIGRQWRHSLDELYSGCREEDESPPSPRLGADDTADLTDSEDNLVWISVHMRDPKHPLFEQKYKKVSKFTKVDFNCLNLVISIDSWVVVLDFFGISDDNADEEAVPTHAHRPTPDVSPDDTGVGNASPESSIVEVCGRVRALSAVLVWRGRELLRARVHRLQLKGAAGGAGLRGTVGALVLEDLARGRWRDTLGTCAADPLSFHYQRFGPAEAAAAGFASTLSVECGGLRYVYTKRMVSELLAFLRDFSLLQRVLARRKAAVASGRARRSRVRVALSPVVIRVPVSQHSPLALEITLHRLAVDNKYMRAGDDGAFSTRRDVDAVDRELLNVRTILLERASLYCVRRGAAGTARVGPSLLTEHCTITLQVEHNVQDTKNVPDLTIYGSLESLEFRVDPSQYSLIRGVLSHNLGEDLSHIDTPKAQKPTASHHLWTLTSLKLDLQNVTVKLEAQHGVSSLACINFIKSSLSVENYSDLSQDIDLVSQEILVSDSRYHREPANRRGNVFGHIVRPLPGTAQGLVQAEVHARRRPGGTAYTVLLNAVRLMAVMDWWDSAIRFLGRPPSAAVSCLDMFHSSESVDGKQSYENMSPKETSLEIKLNITESQVVFVEDASVWDTNAVILKSTTVMSYRSECRKPLSCSLNNVEVYSCVLGLENETSLPIVEPASLQADLDQDRVLHLQTSTLNLRLSYHDMRMFAAMLKSIPAQAKLAAGKAPANSVHMTPRPIADVTPAEDSQIVWPLEAIEVRAEAVTLCVIDDCLDSDVPLLELCLQDLRLEQNIRKTQSTSAGALCACFSADYYNRSLSGWEPVIEPWRVNARWESRVEPRRLQVELCSEDLLSVNITRTLLALVALVRENWTKDLYTQAGSASEHSPSKSSPSGHRRRSPFVPYALCNETGHKLWFTTLVTMSDTLTEQSSELAVDESWTAARPGETVPFCCAGRVGRDLRRKRHQLAVRVAGWRPLGSVSMDRVADYCRVLEHEKSGVRVPILIQISLEGSARKLVTLRGGLLLRNQLPHPVEVRVDHAPAAGEWGVSYCRTCQVSPGGRWSAPLSPTRSAIWARPSAAARPAGPLALCAGLHHAAAGHGDNVYRFCYTGAVRQFPGSNGSGLTITLLPALRIENLLPSELTIKAAGVPVKCVPPGDVLALHEVNAEEGIEISVRLEGFGWSSALSVSPSAASSFGARLRLQDAHGRRLYLNARTLVRREDAVKVSVSAAYWLVNKSGMPLVLGVEGSGAGLAGQTEEHERARAVAPLVFCLPAPDAAPTLQARLGRALYDSPEWCSPFGLGPGTAVKRLEARDADGNDVAVEVGVTVRVGRGRYRHTNIVTISPRYQIHNNTSYTLHLAQKCDIVAPKSSCSGELIAAPGCFLPWQWSSPGRDPLLVVRSSSSAWSGGFRLQAGRSLHIACKERSGGQQFFRAEVVCQGAALFVVLSDARGAPPPLALYNYSPVAVMVAQCGAEESVLGARTGRPAALPEPELSPTLWLRAPGGPRLKLDLRDRDRAPLYLTYQNFVYVAFGATTATDGGCPTGIASAASDNEDMLVLEVPMGTTRVVLAEKRYGDRSQLWKRGPAGQLVHEGSSPPQQTDAVRDEDAPLSAHAMVLDIEGPAPRPGALSALRLRRADPRRSSTQTWRHDAEGRLTCAHAALCVMPDGGLFGLRRGNRVVLGLCGREEWQRVRLVRLRPGSGRLRVSLGRDGPTAVLSITDPAEADGGYVTGTRASGTDRVRTTSSGGESGAEWALAVSLCTAGVSLVAGVELAHAVWSGLSLRVSGGPLHTTLSLTAQDMQWDNQLLDTPSPVLLHRVSRDGELPVLLVDAEVTHCTKQYNAVFFKHLVVTLQPVAIRLEERLILKLWQWFANSGEESPARELPDEADYETQRMLSELTAVHATRYYFGLIKIMPSQIRLSMYTANKLERDLSAFKRHLGLTLIRFEDAAVELQPFEREHHFETAAQLARALIRHFKDQLKWQAAKILGSVDFLGNPLGFVSDVSEGVSGLIYEGSVGALLQNITHGISNSAAKVTESLGDGLERVVVDEAHEETRRKIRSAGAQSHLLAGVRGLGLGLLGGVTSLVKHSYEGAAAEGVAGFLAGVGKGLVGTVTKPVIGVLDLAAETASAVRDTSRRSDRWAPERIRGPRCVWGGLLSRYSRSLSAGAALLHQLSGDAREVCVSYRCLRAAPHDVRALLSARCLRLVTVRDGQAHALLETALGDLVSVAAVSGSGGHYVELGVRGESGAVRRPRVQCDSAEGARWLSEHAAYATALYYDAMHTVPPDDADDAD